MTLATDMFYSGYHPSTMEPIAVARTSDDKKMQKALMRWRIRSWLPGISEP